MTTVNMPLTYEDVGVSVEAGDQFASKIKALTGTSNKAKLLPALGGYAAVYPINENDCIAVTTDGVGTKVILAEQLNDFSTIGIDLVAMCANDLICVGATPTLFLDYYATGRLNADKGLNIIEGILKGCQETGMLLVGGETAEMPDVYTEEQFDLAGFAVGTVQKNRIITGYKAEARQVLIGLASSGVHSNGLSLARKCLTTPEDLRELLTPTTLYVRPILEALKTYPEAITGLANITGGGWRNLCRINKTLGFKINNPLPVPSIFTKIEATGITKSVMYDTFNMGLGFALTVSPEQAEAVLAVLNKFVPAQIIGKTTDLAGQIQY